MVYKAMAGQGGFTPEWCNKYHWAKPKTSTCGTNCDNSIKYNVKGPYKHIAGKYLGGTRSPKETAALLMKELAANGPMPCSLKASSKLQAWKGEGVFNAHGAVEEPGAQATHAVVLVGYGTSNGADYWLIQNSWGSSWGFKGFARIARGRDTLGWETNGCTTLTAIPPSKCKSAARCLNGGAFKTDCSCKCTNGFSGKTCGDCKKSCSGGRETGSSVVKHGKCSCPCKTGFYTRESDTKDCASKIYIGSGTQKIVQFNKKTYIDINNGPGGAKLYSGDMYVAVPQGVKPYSVRDGWNKQGKRAYVCGKSGNAYCAPQTPLGAGYTRNLGVFKGPLAPGTYEVYLFKFLGKNEFGQDKGWKQELKLSQKLVIPTKMCKDKYGNCGTASFLAGGSKGKQNCLHGSSHGIPIRDICCKACKAIGVRPKWQKGISGV